MHWKSRSALVTVKGYYSYYSVSSVSLLEDWSTARGKIAIEWSSVPSREVRGWVIGRGREMAGGPDGSSMPGCSWPVGNLFELAVSERTQE